MSIHRCPIPSYHAKTGPHEDSTLVARQARWGTRIAEELKVWMRRHWIHLLLSPLIFLLFTVVHELAHVLAASAQGAKIIDFSVLPTSENLGHMSYVFPEGSSGSYEAVSIAPYPSWILCISVVLLLCLRRSSFSFPIASSLFLWGFIGAWGDIALAGVSWLESGRGDWSHVVGQSDEIDVLAMALTWVIVLAIGYWVQTRLYREDALTKASYGIVFGLGSFALVLATSILR